VLACPCSGKKCPNSRTLERKSPLTSVSDLSTSEIGLNTSPVSTARRRGRKRPFTPTGLVGNLQLIRVLRNSGASRSRWTFVTEGEEQRERKDVFPEIGASRRSYPSSFGDLEGDYCERVSGL
jgi:hypothetical protein